MKVLLTGGTGFIGSHAVEHYLHTTDWRLVLLEGLNYASSMRRLTEMTCWSAEHKRVQVVFHNLQAPLSEDVKHTVGQPDVVLHFAAETHVDRSLVDPRPFVLTNVLGTMHLLDFAREVGVGKYVQISTDEVYGPAEEGVFYQEEDRLKPSNPYAATKAGADCLAYSYFKSFKLPVLITRTMNNFGERQHPEKFVPKTVRGLIRKEPITIHGTPDQISSRCWLHARNHADAVKFLLDQGRIGDIYHVSSNDEYNALQMAQMISHAFGVNGFEVNWVDFHQCRTGHDRRYALDGMKLMSLGWKPPVSFNQSLERTVKWTIEHPEWVMI